MVNFLPLEGTWVHTRWDGWTG